MQRWAVYGDAAGVAGDLWVDPVIVDVAVEAFLPVTGEGEADRVAVDGARGEGGNNDDVLA